MRCELLPVPCCLSACVHLQVLLNCATRACTEVGIEVLVERRGWRLNDHLARTVLEKIRILAVFWICHQSPLRAQTTVVTLPVPSVYFVRPRCQGCAAVYVEPPRRGQHHLGAFLSASRPACRNTSSCSTNVRAGKSSFAPRATPGLLHRELLPVC